MKNLHKRLLTALFGIPLILFVLYTGGIPFFIFIAAIISLGLFEFFRLVNLKQHKSVKLFIIASCLMIAYAAFSNILLLMTLFSFAIMLFMLVLILKSDFTGLMTALGLFTFPVIYFGWFLSHSLLLRNIGSMESVARHSYQIQELGDPGFFFIVLVISCAFMNDTGAYGVGKWIGKNKLAPSISPGKTLEGTAGGIFASVITAFIVNLIFSLPLNIVWTLTFGITVAAAAVLGDLFESAIKRGTGVKDSGGLLPGHGGIMDRFDSLFFVFPVSYYLVLLYYFSQGIILL